MFLRDKFRSLSVSMKATLVFGIASFAVSGINYITTPIFTRLLSTEEYGLIAVYNSWYTIIQVIATVTLIFPGILNVGLYEHSENRWRYLSSMLGIIAVTTGAMSLVYALAHRFFERLLNLPASLIILMLLTCLITPATAMWTMKQRYEYNYKITFFVSVGSAVFAQIVSVAAVWAARGKWDGNLAVLRLWSAGTVNLLVAVVLYIYLLRKGRCFVDLSVWKGTLIVAIPLIPHYLSSVILNNTDKIMIDRMVGGSEAGIYSLAAVLSAIGVLFWRALNTTFSPFINTKLGRRQFDDIDRVVQVLLATVGMTCFMGALLAPEIIRILATKEYMTGIYVVPPIAVGIFLHAFYDVFSAVSFFHKKSVMIMAASVASAVFNIVTNYIFIQKFGFVAAGYTTLASNLLLMGLHYLNVRRIEPERIYNPRFVLISVILVTVSCLLCNLTYSLAPVIRYVLIAIVLVVMFMRRRTLIEAINAMKV